MSGREEYGFPNTITRAYVVLSRLTPREKQIAQLLIKLGTNKAIALTLGTSHRTVEMQLADIKKKSGIDRVGLIQIFTPIFIPQEELANKIPSPKPATSYHYQTQKPRPPFYSTPENWPKITSVLENAA